MKNIIIIGSGGQSRVIFSILIDQNLFNIAGFCDDDRETGTVIESYGNKKYKVICNTAQLKTNKKKLYAVLGIGDNYQRYKIYSKLNKLNNIKWQKIISKKANVFDKSKVGEGTVIFNNVNIGIGSTIGSHCIINNNCSVDHDCIISDFSSLAPGVITGGGVVINKNCHIGIGTSIKNGIEIQSNTVVGSGSFVNKNCKKNSLYFGIPAKYIKKRSLNTKYL